MSTAEFVKKHGEAFCVKAIERAVNGKERRESPEYQKMVAERRENQKSDPAYQKKVTERRETRKAELAEFRAWKSKAGKAKGK